MSTHVMPPSSAAWMVRTAVVSSCGPHHSGPSSLEPSGAVPRPILLPSSTSVIVVSLGGLVLRSRPYGKP